MDERLVGASTAKLRRGQLLAVAAVAAPLLAAAAGIAELPVVGLVLVVVLAAMLVGAIEVQLRRPLPHLRLSPDGIEGGFGRIAWNDITAVEVVTRPRLPPRRVVVRFRAGGRPLPATREFATIDSIELSADRLEIASSALELGPRELARELERFRRSRSPATERPAGG